jgi:hypothetical protein
MKKKEADFTELLNVLPLTPEQKREILNKRLATLENELPPIVFRNWKGWRHVLPIAPRTVANEDSLGTGPREKIMIGRVVGYPRTALIEWLRQRSKVIL